MKDENYYRRYLKACNERDTAQRQVRDIARDRDHWRAKAQAFQATIDSMPKKFEPWPIGPLIGIG